MASFRLRRALRAMLVVAALLTLAACGSAAEKVTGTGNPNIAASVGGEEISVDTLQDRYERAKQQPEVAQQLASDESGDFKAQLQADILSQLIVGEIIEQWAGELGLSASEEEVTAEREQLVSEVGGEDAFERAVEQAGLTPEQVNVELRRRVLQEKLAKKVAGSGNVSEEDIEAFYEENKDTRFGERVAARHILVEDKAKAADIKRQLERGADFAKLAKAESSDTGSAEQGGDLGEFARGQMVGPFEEAAFGAKEGEIVGPVKTDFGFHIIQVTERSSGQSLEQASDEIRQELSGPEQQNEALRAALTEQTKKADVEVNPRFGKWDGTAGQVTPADPLGDVQEAPAGDAGGEATEGDAGGEATEQATE